MKRINTYQGAVLRWSSYHNDDEYVAWLDNCIATNIWGVPGTYTTEVLDANTEWAEIISQNEVTTKIYANENFYKISEIADGAASTIITTDLSADKALISNSLGKIAVSSATSTELGYLSGVTSAIQDQLDDKQASITGAATTILSSDLSANKAVVSDASGKIAESTTTSTEIGYVSGVTSSLQTQINAKANNTDTTLTGTINWRSDALEDTVDISELISFTSTMGLIEGGQITVSSGLTISVARTIGYASNSEDYATQLLKKVDAAATTLLLPASSSVYVYYTAGSVLSYNVTIPNERSNIILGRVITNATSIVYIEKSQVDSHHWSNYTDIMLKEAFGSIFASGSIVTENISNARQLDMTNGVYFYSEHRLTLAEETSLSFNAYYGNGSGGYTVQSPSSTVSNSLYDDGSGTLASIPTDEYVKHLLVGIKEQTGTQKFLLFYGDSSWSTEAAAIAASLPATPDFVKNTFVRLASIVVKQGVSAIQEIIDERPRVGFSASAVSAAAVSDHGALSGLSDDDHIQYLLANGSRVMSGNLDMDGSDIISVDTVNGVVVETHASRHQPGGADAIPTATAVSIASANAEGVSTSLARADHAHKIDDSFVTNSMLAGSIDAAKIDSGLVSNAEFTTLNGISTGVTIQSQLDGKQATITGAATSITGSDLTASRALASDISGKVAVSATTSAELGFVSGVTSAIQTQLSGKQATITGAITTVANTNLTASRAVVSDSSGKIDISPTTSAELAFVSGVTSVIQDQLNNKQATVIGGASTITSANLAVNRALTSDAGGKVAVSATTDTELGYVSGVTSAIQTQLGSKEPSITSGTTSQYWRGDKSFQTINKADVGLGSVDNVSAADLRDRSTHTGNETQLTWSEGATITTPVAGLTTYAKDVGGRQMFAQRGKSGIDYSFQPFLGRNRITLHQANGNATTLTTVGAVAPTAGGTATTRNVATTNFFTWMRRAGYVSATTGNASSGLRSAVLQYGLGNGASRGGFHFVARFGISDAALATGARLFVGLTPSTGVLGNAEPSTFTNIIGVGLDAADTTLQIMHNDGAGTATKIDLGANFPESTNTDFYELALYCAPNGTTVFYEVVNLTTGIETSGSITTNLPLNTQLLAWQLWRHNVATGVAVGVDISSVYIETDN
jgi:fructose-specific component phosphotransferase system IIB-like protein